MNIRETAYKTSRIAIMHSGVCALFRVSIFIVAMTFTLRAPAGNVNTAGFDPAQLHLNGSSCTFDRKAHETVLAGDWAGKFWIKVDGKIVELISEQTDEEIARQLASKRWHEALRANDLTVEINLAETGRGEDTVAYKGYIKLKRGGSSTRIPVTGGCGA